MVCSLLVEVVGQGVDVEVGQLLAQDGHVFVGHPARDPPAVDGHEPVLALLPCPADRVPGHGGTLGARFAR